MHTLDFGWFIPAKDTHFSDFRGERTIIRDLSFSKFHTLLRLSLACAGLFDFRGGGMVLWSGNVFRDSAGHNRALGAFSFLVPLVSILISEPVRRILADQFSYLVVKK